MLRVINRVGSSVLHTFRRHFGLSQVDLALYLGVSATQINQTESGARMLPAKALVSRAQLLAALDTKPGLASDPLDAATLRARQRQCLHEAGELRFRLEVLIERATIARYRLAALPTLRRGTPGQPPAQPNQLAWLKIFENEALTELRQSGATVQALLAARIAALEREAEALTGILATDEPT